MCGHDAGRGGDSARYLSYVTTITTTAIVTPSLPPTPPFLLYSTPSSLGGERAWLFGGSGGSDGGRNGGVGGSDGVTMAVGSYLVAAAVMGDWGSYLVAVVVMVVVAVFLSGGGGHHLRLRIARQKKEEAHLLLETAFLLPTPHPIETTSVDGAHPWQCYS